ncbi:MAG: hypothetical protein IJS65_08480 [Clostridia bacterium]|nr:hypothetical protein [Clostridia bacterium]
MDERLESVVKKAVSRPEKRAWASVLAETYYQQYVGKADYFDDSIPDAGCSEDEEFFLPVKKRPSGIYDAFSAIVAAGAEINASEDFSNALTAAVGNLDYYMTEFLLSLGAEPRIWPSMDEPSEMTYGQNYYLDDLDIAFFDNRTANDYSSAAEEAILKTARVLIEKGGLKNYSGYGLRVDEKGKLTAEKGRLVRF